MTQKYRVDTDKGSFLVETEAQLLPDGSETPAALEFKQPQQPAATPPTPGFNDERSAGQVALDQAGNVVSGMLSPITALPGMIGSGIEAIGQTLSGGGTSKGQELVKGAAQAITAPITSTVRGLGALIAPNQVQAPTGEEFAQGAQGAGALLGGELMGAGASRLMKARALRAPERAGLQAENRLLAGSRNPEAMAVAAKAGSEGLQVPRGLTQGAIDSKILNQLNTAGAELKAAKMSVPSGKFIARDPILKQLGDAIEKRQVPGAIGQDPVTTSPMRVGELTKLYGELSKLPEQIPFEDLMKVREGMDEVIRDHGGWKEAASSADRAGLQAAREGAGIVRQSLKGISKELDAALEDYHEASQLATVVRLRRPELRGLSGAAEAQRARYRPPGQPGIVGRAGKKALKYGAIGAGGVVGGMAIDELLK